MKKCKTHLNQYEIPPHKVVPIGLIQSWYNITGFIILL